MTCLEVRRQLGTDPARLSAAMREHLARCPGCDAAAREARGLDALLADAFAVKPPGGLEARIEARIASQAQPRGQGEGEGRARPATRARRGRGRTRLRRAGAVAATALLAGLATWGLLPVTPSGPPAPGAGLKAEVVRHVREELFALTATGRAGRDELAETLRPIGLALAHPVAGVRFAANCVVRGKVVAHWVIAGKEAPITVLFLPAERLAAREALAAGHMRGLLLPARYGTVAVVGAPGEALEAIGEQLVRAVTAA